MRINRKLTKREAKLRSEKDREQKAFEQRLVARRAAYHQYVRNARPYTCEACSAKHGNAITPHLAKGKNNV